MERKYAAFISYRHAELDSAVAKSLHTLIEQYRIPKNLRKGGKKRFGIVFRDEEELSATNDLTDKIYTALDNSEHLVVICTRATLQSPWVTKEVEHFLTKHDRSKTHIILADGEPMEVFPYPLTHSQQADGSTVVTEPMAVDVRAENIPTVRKKLKKQVLRLFAAMLNCPYDALALRELRRKRHRITAALSVFLAVAIGFSSVLLVKNRQIDRKNEELDNANAVLEEKNTELDQKNAELEQKNTEVLLRESELLTSNSCEAFQEGDNYAAIYNAALALPAEAEPRPYYAPAEAALLTALSPFDGEESYILRDTVLQQSTPVSNFRISSDGTKLATIDPYSVITIFDTATGEVLNTVQLSIETVYLSFSNVHLLSCPEINGVLAFDGDTVAAVSFDTCDILWTHTASRAVSDFLCSSADGTIFAYVRSSYDEADRATNYELVFLSGKTGEITGTSVFIDGSEYSDDNTLSTYFTGFVSEGIYNGRFSADNSLFVTSYFSKTADNIFTLHYSLTDIASGTSENFCSYEVDDYFSSEEVYFMFFDTDHSIISVRKHSDRNFVLLAERIDINSGRIYWQQEVPKNTLLSSLLTDEDTVFCFTSNTFTYIILNDYVYCLDISSGELISSSKISSKVINAEIANSTFVYTLDNGHYSEAVLSNYGISDLGDPIDLGDTIHIRTWNGGPTAIDETAEYSEAGYVAAVPADDPTSVVIKRASIIEDLFPCEYTGLNDDGSYFSSNRIFPLKDGTLALGPFFKDNTYSFKIIDPDTGEFIKDFPLSSYFSSLYLQFLPDGTGIIEDDRYGNITLYREDGSFTSLYESEYTLLSLEGLFICELPAISASVTLAGTGDVLSAVCTEDTLLLWTNGENLSEVPLPEDLTWLYTDETNAAFLIKVSGDGCVLISDFTDNNTTADRIAIYSIVSEKWSYLELDGIPFAAGDIYLSQQSSKFAILDDNGVLHMYDTAGKKYTEFSLELPANSVYQLEFILDEAYIMVKTTDLQLLIYDTDGSIIYRETNVSQTMTDLYPFHDRENNRLYIATGSSSQLCQGLCIDLGSWTTLARINGLIYFNEDTLEMYRVDYLEESYSTGLVTQTLPPAETLAALAREFLGI